MDIYFNSNQCVWNVYFLFLWGLWFLVELFQQLFDYFLVHVSSLLFTKALLVWDGVDSIGDDVAVPV